MKKTITKILSVMLIVVMALTSAPLSGFVGVDLPESLDFSVKASAITEDDLLSAQEVFLDETVVVESGTEGVYIKFTPTEYYGYYTICSDNGDNSNECDPFVQMYDAYGNYVASNDDDDTFEYYSTQNFSLNFCVDAYDTCYFYIGSFKNTTSFKFSISYSYDEMVDSYDRNFGTCGENIKWKMDNSFLKIYGTGAMPDYPAWSGFDDETHYVWIEDGITSIGNDAFRCFTNLEYITIPDSVTSIGSWAFYYCTSLYGDMTLDNVTTIGEYAFDHCESLSSVKFGDSIKTIGEHAFSYCTSLSSITIPYGITTINEHTFYHSALKSVTIPDSVTTIGDYAFCETPLESVTIPDSVTTIGNRAFAFCRLLKNITIPESVTSIGELAFLYPMSLTDFTVDSDNQYYSSDEYGVLFNKDKTTLIQHPIGNTSTSYIIPNSVTKICDDALFYSKNLTDVYYCGTQEEWNAIEIDDSDTSLNTKLRYHNYVDGTCTICGENKMILETMTSQIRFNTTAEKAYTGTFDVRTRVMISDEDFKELVGETNAEAVENIDKIGFVYTINGEDFSAESAKEVAQGGTVAGYIDAPVKNIQDAEGYYMFTCLVTDIPETDNNYVLTAYAYICVNGKWYVSEAPMDADFEVLYDTYYPVAAEKFGWEA